MADVNRDVLDALVAEAVALLGDAEAESLGRAPAPSSEYGASVQQPNPRALFRFAEKQCSARAVSSWLAQAHDALRDGAWRVFLHGSIGLIPRTSPFWLACAGLG